jgi:hypothetical protein
MYNALRAAIVWGVLASLLAAPEILAQPSSTGIGIETTGAACCISIRHWTTFTTGSELLVAASRDLFITLRGLNRLGGTSQISGYAGAGITLAFGRTRPLPASLIQSFQILFGIEVAAPLIVPQFALNVEAAIEMDLQQDFFSHLGGGIHFYF